MFTTLTRALIILVAMAGIGWSATSTDVIDVVATTTVAQEGGAPGRFTLSRTGSSGTLVVTLTLEGSAKYSSAADPAPSAPAAADKDYNLSLDASAIGLGASISALSATPGTTFTVTMGPGQQNVDLIVTAWDDAIKELQEDVRLRIVQQPFYIVGANSVATVIVADNDVLASMYMPDQTLSEFRGDPSPEGNFEVRFNDADTVRYLVTQLGGAATFATDYKPQVMFMHLPSGGDVTSLSLAGASVNYVMTGFSGNLKGSGWYVNTPPTVTFPDVTTSEQVAMISAIAVTASDSNWIPGTTPVIDMMTSSLTSGGRRGRGYGVIDASGNLVAVKLLDAGVYQYPDINGVTYLVNSGTANASLQVSATLPSGSRVTGAAVLNALVSDIVLTNPGSGYTKVTVAITGGGGSDATAVASLSGTSVSGITITNPGFGYTSIPTITLVGDGSGASAQATIEGPVVRVDVTNAGLGYHVAPSNFTFSDPTGVAKVTSPALTTALSSHFSMGFAPRVDNPDFFNRRSSWSALLNTGDSNSSFMNKAGFSTVSVIAGTGPLTVGDYIGIGNDPTRYLVVAKSLPTEVTGDIYYKLTVSPSLQQDVGNGVEVTNAPVINADIDAVQLPSVGVTNVYGVHIGITPIDDAIPEGAESVTLRVLASNDFAIQNPTIQTMDIADDDSIADIQWMANASEPNLSGLARVTLSAALPIDVVIPYRISGSATPGAGLPTDPLNNLAYGQYRDYILTGLTSIVPPVFSGTALQTPASAKGFVTIPAGQTHMDIVIGVQNDSVTEGTEDVSITLQGSKDVVLAGSSSTGTNPSATINIADNLGSVSVGYIENGAEDPTAPVTGKIRFLVDSNAGVTPTNIGVSFNIGGSATYNSDYVLGGNGFTVNPATGAGSVVLPVHSPIWLKSAATSGASGSVDALLVSEDTTTVLASGQTLVIGANAYTINSVGAGSLLESGPGLAVNLTPTTTSTFDPLLGATISLGAAVAQGARKINLIANGNFILPPQVGLRIQDRIYVTANTSAITLSTSGQDVDIASDMEASFAAGFAVDLAVRPAVDLLIQVKDDLIAESPEAVTVVMQSGSGYSINPVGSTASSVIQDDEPEMNIEIQTAAYEPNSNGTFRIYYTKPATPLNRNFVVKYSVLSGAFYIDTLGISHDLAQPSGTGKDYEALSGTATIPAGSSFVDVPVVVTADNRVENDEEIVISITDPADLAYKPQISSAIMLVYDAPVVSFSTVHQDLSEDDPSGTGKGSVTFVRTATGAGADVYAGDIVVQADVNASSTAAPGSASLSTGDYDTDTATSAFSFDSNLRVYSITATIKAGQSSVTVPITPLDDSVADKGEVLAFTLHASNNYTIDSAQNTAVLNIVDNEPSVSFSKVTDANEGGSPGQFKIDIVSGASSAPFSIPVHLSGSAIYGSDYTAVQVGGSNVTVDGNNTCIIPVTAGASSVLVNIVPRTANGTADPVRTVTATLRLGMNTIGAGTDSTLAVHTASLVINDDRPVVSVTRLTSNAVDLAEPSTNGGFRISVNPPVPVGIPLTVNFTLSGTATLGTDYSVVTTPQVTVSSAVIDAAINGSSVDVMLSPIDDAVVEGLETIDVQLAVNGTVYSINPNAGVANLLMGDDEFTGGKAVVEIVSNTVTASESGQVPGTYTISRSYGIGPLSVAFVMSGTSSTSDYTISGPGVIFNAGAATGTVTLPQGTTSTILTLTPIDDQVAEGIETAVCSILPQVVYDIGSKNAANIDIADNDIVATLNVVDPLASERSLDPGQFRVTCSPSPVARHMVIRVEGTGLWGTHNDVTSDFYLAYRYEGQTSFTDIGTFPTPMPPSSRLFFTIPAGVNFVDFSVGICVGSNGLEDNIAEGAETAIFTLEASNEYALGSPSSGQINIADNDVLVTLAAVDGGEPATNGAFIVTLSQPFPLGVDVNIPFSVNSGTAIAGTDYKPLRSLKIPGGQTTGTISVDVLSDTSEESTETVSISLVNSLDYVIYGSATATVNIADQYATVGVTAGAPAVEPSTPGTFTITATRIPRLDGTQPGFSIGYTLTGSATSGVDYAVPASVGRLMMPTMTSTATVTIAPLDDVLAEGDETIILTLQSGPGYDVSPSLASATLTMQDDEPVISIAKQQDGAEPNTPAGFTVSYPGVPAGTALARPITVKYQLDTSSTATSDTDFAAVSGTVTIPANQLSVTFQVPVLDDKLVEPTETIALQLLPDVGYSLSGASGATLVVANLVDNEPKLSVTVGGNASEPATSGSFIISSALPVTGDTTVAFTLSGTAVNSNDYLTVTSPATIPNGLSSTTVTITPKDNTLLDGTRTVILTITPSAGYTIVSGSGTATLNVNDNELPQVSINKVNDAAEPATNGKFRISVTPAFSVTTTVAFTVSGTATSGADYTALPASVSLAVGATSVDVSVPVLADSVTESTETVVVTLTPAPSTYSISPTLNQATVSITDQVIIGNPNSVLSGGSSGGCGLGSGVAALLGGLGLALLALRARSKASV